MKRYLSNANADAGYPRPTPTLPQRRSALASTLLNDLDACQGLMDILGGVPMDDPVASPKSQSLSLSWYQTASCMCTEIRERLTPLMVRQLQSHPVTHVLSTVIIH